MPLSYQKDAPSASQKVILRARRSESKEGTVEGLFSQGKRFATRQIYDTIFTENESKANLR